MFRGAGMQGLNMQGANRGGHLRFANRGGGCQGRDVLDGFPFALARGPAMFALVCHKWCRR